MNFCLLMMNFITLMRRQKCFQKLLKAPEVLYKIALQLNFSSVFIIPHSKRRKIASRK